jgi:cytochrome c oxidase cbb3-type subunit I/II
MQVEKFYYDNKIVKQFGIATLFWGIIGMLVGIIIAFQLAYPALNFGISYLPPLDA